MMAAIGSSQRFTAHHPCPICGGHGRLQRGHAERCFGFLSDDGKWAHCTREEKAGNLPLHEGSGAYVHRLGGDCKCGTCHSGSTVAASNRPHETVYFICDEHGKPVAQHKRIDRANGEKTFVWCSPDGRTGLNGRPVDSLPLYGVHLLQDRPDEPVIVTEGEKAATALQTSGRLAVGTVTGAAGTPRREALNPLIGRQVFLWPDNDADGKGQAHMARIAKELRKLRIETHIVQWSDAPPKGDAFDFIHRHGGMMRSIAYWKGRRVRRLPRIPKMAMMKWLAHLAKFGSLGLAYFSRMCTAKILTGYRPAVWHAEKLPSWKETPA